MTARSRCCRFPDGRVQLPVKAEVQRSAIVVVRVQVIEVEEHQLAASHCDIAVGGEPADTIVNARRLCRVVDVNELVGGEIRVECDAEQAALPIGVNVQGDKSSRVRALRS